jgi:hypothetical protein
MKFSNPDLSEEKKQATDQAEMLAGKDSLKNETLNNTRLMTEEELRTTMRSLCENHANWTRNLIFCVIDDLPGKEEAFAQLLENQEKIGETIQSFYGTETAIRFTDLMGLHIFMAGHLLNTVKKEDAVQYEEINSDLENNADAIADLLCKTNPDLSSADMKLMLQINLELTIEEAKARMEKDYVADIKVYEKAHAEMNKFADMLSEGIIRQFPDRFVDEVMGMKK